MTHDEKIDAVKKQVYEAADTLAATFGPQGKYALVCPQDGRAYFTRDGVTVAQNLDRNQPGVNLLVDACKATVDKAGDGTTSTAILAAAFMRLGIDPTELIEKAVAYVKKASFPPSQDELTQVAAAASHDLKLAKMVAECAFRLGADGHIRAEVGKKDAVTLQPGYDLGSGALIPQFMSPKKGMPGVSKNSKGEVTIENPMVLLVEEKIAVAKALFPILESYRNKTGVFQNGKFTGVFKRPLVMVVGDMEEDALRFIVANFQECNVPIFLVKSPSGGQQRFDILTDLQYLVGTPKIYSKFNGVTLKQFKGDFGEADQVILSGHGEGRSCRFLKKGVDLGARIDEIKATEDDTPQRDERVSKLSGAVGVITFGPDLYSRLMNRQLVVEDTVLASLNAMKHGFVPGGKALWGEKLPEACPELEGAFKEIAKRLPSGQPLDAALTVECILESAAALAGQFANTGAVVGKTMNDV